MVDTDRALRKVIKANEKEKTKQSNIDDYADTSQEMPSYIDGDD